MRQDTSVGGHCSRSSVVLSESGSPPIVAAIDIGSNSIKMTVAQLASGGAIRDIGWRSEVVRLGAGIDQTGRLADDRVEAALDILVRFAGDAATMGASRMVAVATEAVRVAANGPQFLDRVRRETGIDVATIDGEREAELSFRGLVVTTDVSGEVLVADIGGGSTELIVARDGEPVGAGSVPVGSGRLTDRFVVADPPMAHELAHCRDSALTVLRPLHGRLLGASGSAYRLILVGGTGEYLGRLAAAGDRLSSADVASVLARVQEMTAAALATQLHIPEARARVLPAGIAVVAALIDLVAPTTISVAQSGIRAGLLLEAFTEMTHPTAEPTES